MSTWVTISFDAVTHFRSPVDVYNATDWLHAVDVHERIDMRVPKCSMVRLEYERHPLWSQILCLSGSLYVAETPPPKVGTLHFETSFFPFIDVLIPVASRRVSYIESTLKHWNSLLGATNEVQLHVFYLDQLQEHRHLQIHSYLANWTRASRSAVERHKQDVLHMLYRLPTSRADLVMFAEDDFVPCYDLVEGLLRSFSNTSAVTHMSAYYASVGLNGLIFNRADVPAIVRYIKAKIIHPKQVDHLLQEWMLKETPAARTDVGDRTPFVYKHMLFRHVGQVSSQGHKHSSTAFQCGDTMHGAHFPGIDSDMRCAWLTPCWAALTEPRIVRAIEYDR
jgi:hypothetical protein